MLLGGDSRDQVLPLIRRLGIDFGILIMWFLVEAEGLRVVSILETLLFVSMEHIHETK
jgi:hypothetical protein